MAQSPSPSSSRIQRRLWKAGRLEWTKSQPSGQAPVRSGADSGR
jgi:hypothetical protein